VGNYRSLPRIEQYVHESLTQHKWGAESSAPHLRNRHAISNICWNDR